MDPALVQAVSGVILGLGTLLGAYNAYKTQKSRRRGIPADERLARRITDTTSLNRYWSSELDQARQDRRAEIADLRQQLAGARKQAEADSVHIDKLEEWIWLQKPPPPPRREPPTEEGK